jgi:hypothetical protein
MRISHVANPLTVAAIGFAFALTACSGPRELPASTAISQSSSAIHPDNKFSGEVLISDGEKDRCHETTDSQGGFNIDGIFGAVGYASGPIPGEFTLTGKILAQGPSSPSQTLRERFTITSGSHVVSGTIKYSVTGASGGIVTCTKHKLRFDFASVPYTLKGGAQGTASAVLRKEIAESFL